MKNECPSCKLNPLTDIKVENMIYNYEWSLEYMFTPWCLLECSHLVCLCCADNLFRRLIENDKIGCVVSGCGHRFKSRPEARMGIKSPMTYRWPCPPVPVHGPRNENEEYEVDIMQLAKFVKNVIPQTTEQSQYSNSMSGIEIEKAKQEKLKYEIKLLNDSLSNKVECIQGYENKNVEIEEELKKLNKTVRELRAKRKENLGILILCRIYNISELHCLC